MDVAAVYLQVMRSVIDGVRADFSTEQLDEAALTALAKLWEKKVLETRTLLKEIDREPSEGTPNVDKQEEKQKRASELPGKVKSSPSTQGGPLSGKLQAPVCNTDEILSSDSDDDDGDAHSDLQNDEEMDVQNLVLAQFEKVTRAKSKWKCILKEGTMTLKGKDSLFGKAGGEFTW